MHPSNPEHVVIYCRISADLTGQALGVQRQETECRELAALNGWSVNETFVDNDASATTGKRRPGFEALLASGAGRIIVWHTDRLVRLTKDLERVIQLGIPVHAVTEGNLNLATSGGRAVARTLTAWATYEGEVKAERQRAQQRQRAEAGKPWWIIRPFGYDKEGTRQDRVIVQVPREVALVRQAYADLNRGGTYAAITRQWNGAAILTTKGKPWSPTTVRQLLHSPRNAGLLESKGEVIGKGLWEPIIGEDEWRGILGRAGSPALNGRGQGHRKGLLSGIATCGVCAAVGAHSFVMWRSRSSKARGEVRKVYGAKCGHATAPVEWLDDYVQKAVLRKLSSPAAALAWGPVVGQDKAANEAQGRADEVRKRLEDAADSYAAGEISRAQLARVSTTLRQQLEPLEAVAERAYHPSPLGEQPSLAGLLASWKSDDLGAEGRRAIIRSMAESIEIHAKRKGAKMSEAAVTIKWRDW